MPGRKMLRDIMSVSDIYSFSDSIIEMLREDYGTYDADSLDEVTVEDTFAQRLAARGYDVRSLSESEAAQSPAPARPPITEPVAPVTIVRQRRTAAGSPRPGTGAERPVAGARPGADAERPVAGARPGAGVEQSSSTPTRTRRTTAASDAPRPTTSAESSRASGENSRADSESPRATADATRATGDSAAAPAAPTRTRRTTRTPRTNGSSE